MNKIFKLSIPILFLSFATFAGAHSPHFIGSREHYLITDPLMSQAFYGYLPGEPAKFVVSSSSAFSLFVELLVPVVPESSKDLNLAVVNQNGKVVGRLTGNDSAWTRWHEEFAGDDYYRGQSLAKALPAGTYTILVSSVENWERYVLVVGNKEEFSLRGLPSLMRELYYVKTDFFQKKLSSIFEGKIGRYLLIGISFAVIILMGLAWLARQQIKRLL